MFALLLLWLLIGLFLGLLALPANFHPTLKHGWLLLPLSGALASLRSGLLGLWLLGRDTATALCFCLTILALILIPHLIPPRNRQKITP